MSFLKNAAAIALLFSVLFTGCSEKSDPVAAPAADPFAGITKRSEAYVTGIATKMQLWSATPLVAGYNQVYIALLDSASGNFVEDAHIHLDPMMDMGMMKHSAPYENPASTKAVNKLFPAKIYFVMASMGGTWTVDAEVHNHLTDKEGVVSLPVSVMAPTLATLKSLVAKDDSSKVFVTIVRPTKPVVGLNDFEITIHRTKDMMTFTPDSLCTVTLTPEMPSMGHGSPNNVDPVNSGKGHYTGKVNFTMTGDWRINLDIKKNGVVVDTTLYFDTTL